MTTGQVFLNSAIKRLAYYKELGDKTFEQLSGADFHISPGAESNSIEMVIKHVSGNMLSRWTDFLTTDGEKEWRKRDSEFEEEKLGKEQLLALWEKGWACCLDALRSLTDEDLDKVIYIRSEGLLVTDAINRQLAHYPYHVGQIVYLGRMIKGSGWKNLSIPRGHSDSFNAEMKQKQH
jgi:Protein of unknown function (DUF1572)